MGRWNKETIYWDSCIFLAWITGEQRPNDEMNGVFDCVEKVDNNVINLVTYKDTTEMEVLQANMSDDDKRVFDRLFARRNVIFLGYHPRIQAIAKEIREYGEEDKKRVKGLKSIGQSDAYHLAAAIHNQVDAFYTFDDGKRSKMRSLLSLDGNVAGYKLLICKPPFTEARLFLMKENPVE